MTDFGRRTVCPECPECPECPVCPEVVPNVLPKTGQTIEYWPGDDGTYQAGWEGERFTDNGDGTITDNATSLMWIKDALDPAINMIDRTWYDQVDHIEALEYAGHADWRMPNMNELMSLIDWAFTFVLINEVFLNAQDIRLQSSTTDGTGETDWVWYWSGWYNYPEEYEKTSLNKSLCVRVK